MASRNNIENAGGDSYFYHFSEEERPLFSGLGDLIKTGRRKDVLSGLRKFLQNQYGLTEDEANSRELPGWITDAALQGKGADPAEFNDAFLLIIPRPDLVKKEPEVEFLKHLGPGRWKVKYDNVGIKK